MSENKQITIEFPNRGKTLTLPLIF